MALEATSFFSLVQTQLADQHAEHIENRARADDRRNDPRPAAVRTPGTVAKIERAIRTACRAKKDKTFTLLNIGFAVEPEHRRGFPSLDKIFADEQGCPPNLQRVFFVHNDADKRWILERFERSSPGGEQYHEQEDRKVRVGVVDNLHLVPRFLERSLEESDMLDLIGNVDLVVTNLMTCCCPESAGTNPTDVCGFLHVARPGDVAVQGLVVPDAARMTTSVEDFGRADERPRPCALSNAFAALSLLLKPDGAQLHLSLGAERHVHGMDYGKTFREPKLLLRDAASLLRSGADHFASTLNMVPGTYVVDEVLFSAHCERERGVYFAQEIVVVALGRPDDGGMARIRAKCVGGRPHEETAN